MTNILILLCVCVGGMLYQYKYSKTKNYQKFRKLGLDKNIKTNSIFGMAMGLVPKAVDVTKNMFGGGKGGFNMTIGEIAKQKIANKSGGAPTTSMGSPTGREVDPTVNPNAKFLGIGTTWFQRNWQKVLLYGVLPLTLIIGLIIYMVKRKSKKSFK